MRESTANSPGAPPRRRHVLYLAGAALALAACIGNHPKACTSNSECGGGVCDGQGFCAQECTQASDCPCGSICDNSCGLCLRVDNGGLATCFAPLRNISIREALGACRGPIVPAPAAADAGTDDGGADGGMSTPSPAADAACPPFPDVLMCGAGDAGTPPPSDASADSSSDDASKADVGDMTDGPGAGVES